MSSRPKLFLPPSVDVPTFDVTVHFLPFFSTTMGIDASVATTIGTIVAPRSNCRTTGPQWFAKKPTQDKSIRTYHCTDKIEQLTPVSPAGVTGVSAINPIWESDPRHCEQGHGSLIHNGKHTIRIKSLTPPPPSLFCL